MRVVASSAVFTPENCVSAVSIGISVYQAYEARRTMKILKRIHRIGYRTELTRRTHALRIRKPGDKN